MREPSSHPRAEDGVGVALGKRGDEILDDLGRILTVAVQQHDQVKAMVDRLVVPALLVPAVTRLRGWRTIVNGRSVVSW